MIAKPGKGKKIIQIGPKTWIEVDESIDNNLAIERYHERQQLQPKSRAGRPKGGSRPEIEEDK